MLIITTGRNGELYSVNFLENLLQFQPEEQLLRTYCKNYMYMYYYVCHTNMFF